MCVRWFCLFKPVQDRSVGWYGEGSSSGLRSLGTGHCLAMSDGHQEDFPGAPVVKNPLANAGDTGLIPSPGTKISHAPEHLCTCTTTTEPTCLEPTS